MKGKKAKINKIMAEFDFRVVKDNLVACNTTWLDKEGKEYIPSIDELKTKARELLVSTTNTGTSYCKIASNNFICRKTNTSLELTYYIESKWA